MYLHLVWKVQYFTFYSKKYEKYKYMYFRPSSDSE
jgi:hypothetical protein